MGLDSLLTSLNRDVTAVTDVHPKQRKASGCNGTKSTGVTDVTESGLARIFHQSRSAESP
jgi:hypothetical protein